MAFAQLSELRETLETATERRQRAILQDFQQARQQAGLQEVFAYITGQSNCLLSFEDVTQRLHLAGRADGGMQEIPLAAIVGSVGRHTDFTRTFLPRRDSDQARWARIRAAYAGPELTRLPPIEVYKIGDVYFVLDGNHRVSVARQQCLTHIEAHVIEVPTAVPLTPDVRLEDLIVKAEYADFLEQTGLKGAPNQCDLSLTTPGGYQRLREEIEIFRATHEPAIPAEARLNPAQPTEADLEAAGAWYAQGYLPTVLAIRERGLLRWFPGRTETDLYLWICEHRQALEKDLGWAVRPEAAISDLAVKESAQAKSETALPGSWRKTRLVDRYADRLFRDILVPLENGVDSWPALDQALVIAQREGAQVHGLHITADEAQGAGAAAQSLRERFQKQCAAAGITGSLSIEAGDVKRKICERALLTDLVVLSAAHPPAAGLASLGSGLRAIIWDCARPLLAVPEAAAPLDRALLTYDGSPKAKEALFVAAYLAERWHTALVVLTLLDRPRVPESVLDYPRAYLELHEIQAEFVVAAGNEDVFAKTVLERQANLVLMGGYSVPALTEVMGGSAVNHLLRQARCPLFLCR